MWASLACLCLIGACLIKTCPQRRKCLEQTCQLIKLWGLAIAEQIIVQSKFWSKFTVFALVSSPSRSPHSHSHHKTWIFKLTSYLFQMNDEILQLVFGVKGSDILSGCIWNLCHWFSVSQWYTSDWLETFQYSSHQASANEISFDKTTLLTPQVLL